VRALRAATTLKFQQQRETITFELPGIAEYEVVALRKVLKDLQLRNASPAARRLAKCISEYLRERITPSAPAPRAARTASRTSCGSVFFSSWPVGMSMSIPGQIFGEPGVFAAGADSGEWEETPVMRVAFPVPHNRPEVPWRASSARLAPLIVLHFVGEAQHFFS